MSDRLDSWKKIAVYLKRDVTTVQRWERREGMPVHRHLHDKQGSVFAFRSELDEWSVQRQVQAGAALSASVSLPPEALGSDPVLPARGTSSSPALRWVAVALVLLALAGAITWFASHPASSWHNPLAGAKFSRLSDFAGTEQAAAISPDGKLVAVVASRGDQADAWVSEIGTGVYRNVTQGKLQELVNPSIRTLGFSKDSSQVFIWTRKGDGTHPQDVSIYAAPTAGGPLAPYLKNAAEFDWSRDGRRLVYHTTAPGDPIFTRARH